MNSIRDLSHIQVVFAYPQNKAKSNFIGEVRSQLTGKCHTDERPISGVNCRVEITEVPHKELWLSSDDLGIQSNTLIIDNDTQNPSSGVAEEPDNYKDIAKVTHYVKSILQARGIHIRELT